MPHIFYDSFLTGRSKRTISSKPFQSPKVSTVLISMLNILYLQDWLAKIQFQKCQHLCNNKLLGLSLFNDKFLINFRIKIYNWLYHLLLKSVLLATLLHHLLSNLSFSIIIIVFKQINKDVLLTHHSLVHVILSTLVMCTPILKSFSLRVSL